MKTFRIAYFDYEQYCENGVLIKANHYIHALNIFKKRYPNFVPLKRWGVK